MHPILLLKPQPLYLFPVSSLIPFPGLTLFFPLLPKAKVFLLLCPFQKAGNYLWWGKLLSFVPLAP